jgi:hypothetical protein
VAVGIACGRSNPIGPSDPARGGIGAAPDGSTLKIAAPPPVLPTDNFQFLGGTLPVALSWTNVSGTFASFPVSYEVEVRNAAGAVVANPKGIPASSGDTTSWTVTPALAGDTVHAWRVRATFNQAFGPWSAGRQFKTGPLAFLSNLNSTIFDPLTTGFSVGQVRGGQFSPEGWTATKGSDGIDYDISTCTSCRLEFDILGFDDGLYLFGQGEAKILSMGNARAFGNFQDFRDHEWKMHFSIRSDGDGTGLDVVWRNGGFGDGENPGDHRVKVEPGPRWSESQATRVTLEWSPRGYLVFINGMEWIDEDFEGDAYAPPNHRISLGCYPRNETFEFATFRNVRLTPLN